MRSFLCVQQSRVVSAYKASIQVAAIVTKRSISRAKGARTEKAHAATVLLSGGIDSAACARFMQERSFEVSALFVDYGQLPARREFRAAKAIAAHLDIPLKRVQVTEIVSAGAGELPGRNAFFICSAILATRARPGIVVLGLHGGTPYYDCSEPFLASISQLTAEMTDGSVSVIAPFVKWSKRDIYDYFISRNLPIESTYSCEAGSAGPCGNCLSCRDRRSLGC